MANQTKSETETFDLTKKSNLTKPVKEMSRSMKLRLSEIVKADDKIKEAISEVISTYGSTSAVHALTRACYEASKGDADAFMGLHAKFLGENASAVRLRYQAIYKMKAPERTASAEAATDEELEAVDKMLESLIG